MNRFCALLLAATLLAAGLSASPAAAVPAVAASLSTHVASELDASSVSWYVASGPGTTTVQASPRTSGSGSLKVSYDFRAGSQVQLAPSAGPVDLPGLPRTVSVDVLGDGSWNVIYLQLRDSAGEIFHYRLGNMSFTGWQTLAVDPGRIAPAATLGGDRDGVLDLPVHVFRLVVDRNPGGTKLVSTIALDRLAVEYENWHPLSVSTAIFLPVSGQATTLSMGLVEAATFSVTLRDEAGRSRVWTDSAPGGGALRTLRWNGRDGAGTIMTGSVRGHIAITRGAAKWAYEISYLAGLPTRPEPSIPGSIVGVNSNMTQIGTHEADRAAEQARLMEGAWIRQAREGFDWNRVEPRKGWHDWAPFDQAVELARAHNVSLVGVLGYSAAWASSAPSGAPAPDRQFYPPRSNADFAAYARAVVARYKDRVKVWEVWNEPNLATFWKPAPNAGAYAALLKSAYAAIKAEDPSATVLVGGLAAADLPYIKGLHSSGAWAAFDGLAIHTYVAGQPESSMIPTWLDNTRAYVASKGDKPIWITELGWSTYAGSGSGYIGVTESQQAEYTARAYLMAARAGVAGVFAYNLVEVGTSSTSKLHNYGLVEQGGRRKPGYGALRRIAEALDQGTTGGVADPDAALRKTASGLDSTTGWAVSPLGGGSASISRSTSVRHAGSASIQLKYSFTASSTGAELRTNIPLPGSATSVSLWVHGDGSANPVYLKVMDKTGETFQAAVGSLQDGWQRLTLYADGGDINWSHKGGDNDGRFDYPISLRNVFVFRGGIGQLSGTVQFDTLQADYGPRVRGVVASRRNGNVQALYSLDGSVTQAVPVPGSNAWLIDGWTSTRLTPSGGKVDVALNAMPKNVLATVGTSPTSFDPRAAERSTITWAAGDRMRATFQVLSVHTGKTVRHVWVDRWFDAGLRSTTWDGKVAGVPAAPGAYRLRLAVIGPDGRVSYLFSTVNVE
jgi:large repetitive protein